MYIKYTNNIRIRTRCKCKRAIYGMNKISRCHKIPKHMLDLLILKAKREKSIILFHKLKQNETKIIREKERS